MVVEVQRAIEIGLDGFLFDILTTDRSNPIAFRFDQLLTAAASVNSNFVLGFMPDMTAEFSTSPQNMVPYLLQYANRSNILRYLDKQVVAPFDAGLQTSGWWDAQLSALNAEFLPLFLSIGAPLLPYVNISFGAASWGGQQVSYVDAVIFEGNYVHKQNLSIWYSPFLQAPYDRTLIIFLPFLGWHQ